MLALTRYISSINELLPHTLKVIHENPPNSTSNGVSATVDEGGFLRGNKDKGKVIVFTAPKGTAAAANGR